MHILWLAWRDFKNPKLGGAETAAIETTSRFVKDGHQVTLFTSYFEGAKSFETVKGVKIIRQGNQLTCRLYAWNFYRKNKNFNLVIDEINTIPFFTPFYCPKKSAPFIHQMAKEYWFKLTPWPINLIGYLIEPLMLLPYRNMPIMTVSNSTKEDLEKIGFKKFSFIREGILVTPHPPGQKKDIILFIGRLVEAKNPLDAIMAFQKIKKSFPQYKLVVIGKGEANYENKLKKFASQNHLRKNVEFTGFITEKAKERFLREAKIVLIPSIREGWNIVATEAHAQGCIPVGYKVAGLKDSVKDGVTGLLVEGGPNELSKAAVRILNNEDLRKKMALEGYRWGKNFSWTNFYEDINKYIRTQKKLS